jgi:hypothetical protein
MTDGRPVAGTGPSRSFAHASEAELARILDFYDVRWEYEPHTFPILWNLEGAVVESFTPDFFLPDLDIYLELTTLKQTLVRKKNRKLRRLRELYPDLQVKLFYARDFRALMLKFGRVALINELSGTSGQVVPERIDLGSLEAAPAVAVTLAGTDAAIAEVEAAGTLTTDAAATAAEEEARRAARRAARRRRRRRSIAAHLAGSPPPR